MVTIWFAANGLRPDYARYSGPNAVADAEAALVNLIHVRFAGLPLRVRVSHGGRIVYQFDRRAAGEG